MDIDNELVQTINIVGVVLNIERYCSFHFTNLLFLSIIKCVTDILKI